MQILHWEDILGMLYTHTKSRDRENLRDFLKSSKDRSRGHITPIL